MVGILHVLYLSAKSFKILVILIHNRDDSILKGNISVGKYHFVYVERETPFLGHVSDLELYQINKYFE